MHSFVVSLPEGLDHHHLEFRDGLQAAKRFSGPQVTTTGHPEKTETDGQLYSQSFTLCFVESMYTLCTHMLYI